MSFYIDVKGMLKDYGTDIKVYKPNDTNDNHNFHFVAGIRDSSENEDYEAPELRHEPFLPNSNSSAQLAQLLSGGASIQGDYIWLSSDKYPIGTIVESETQGGKYRVISYSNYQDYSNLIVYELKGDKQHPDGI
ncbi:hypothetical protein J2Z60_001068 [Lactobacillus colini]|uniref:Phage protein n=1 Tax=Lactobacillus colini TaxID=1819254 RepID=A0ABS4MDX6_9LACO|nr:hypothetical protein [Lactobacillus colini]MBP2057893.1 hypothetical protein [Lactobacillus colini]